MLVSFDVWPPRFRSLDLSGARRADCPACGQRRFDFLDRPPEAGRAALCGQDAVQVRPAAAVPLDLARLADRLGNAGVVQRTAFLVRCDLSEPAGVRLTVFPDGRAIIAGTTDIARARTIYARFIGV